MADPSRIFALGASTQSQGLSWRDFKGNFSETTFMDQVTMPAMLKEPNAEWDGVIDVKRLRGVLETARSQVISVQGTVQNLIEEQGTKCKEAEQTLQTDCDGLVEKLHGLVKNYDVISDKYTTVSSSSVAVGQNLKSLNSQKERAEKTQRLLRNFLAFKEDENYMQEMLVSTESLIQLSGPLEELVTLCEGLDMNEYSDVITRIQKRVQSVVDRVNELFEEASMTENLSQLAQMTSCLSLFQKGAGVYQTYIHISINKMKSELSNISLSDRMFDDYIVYYNTYFTKLIELLKKEIETVYSIFERDVVCSVNVSLIDRIFNDQTLGVQFLLAMNNGCVTLTKEEKFELLVQIYENSKRFYDEVVSVIKKHEKNLLGHAERIIREEENLTTSLEQSFSDHITSYFNEELVNLDLQFKNTISSTLSLNLALGASKSDIKTAIKAYHDKSSEESIHDFVIVSLTPIAVIEIYNTAYRTINRLKRMQCKLNMLSRVAEVIMTSITDYLNLVLDVVLALNAKDYPSTQLPGSVPLPTNTALLDTIQTLNGVINCVQQNYLTRIRCDLDVDSEEYQICEIEVKKMYISIEKKISALLQETLRQDIAYLTYLFEGYSRDSVFQPPQNISITRASDVAFTITGWLKKHMDTIGFALDGGNYIQYTELLLLNFQTCCYEGFMKVKKVSNSGIIILTLDYALYEEVLLKMNIESISAFLRTFKKMIHLISIPQSLLKNHVQDNDLLTINRKYILQMIKLRSDYYRNEEVKELYQQLSNM